MPFNTVLFFVASTERVCTILRSTYICLLDLLVDSTRYQKTRARTRKMFGLVSPSGVQQTRYALRQSTTCNNPRWRVFVFKVRTSLNGLIMSNAAQKVNFVCAIILPSQRFELLIDSAVTVAGWWLYTLVKLVFFHVHQWLFLHKTFYVLLNRGMSIANRKI